VADEDRLMVKLNEITDMLSAITTGRIREIINPVAAGTSPFPCNANCDCKGGYCACNARVSKSERFGNISFAEFLELREARMNELRLELASLEAPKALKEIE
jgi:hypothetical protein